MAQPKKQRKKPAAKNESLPPIVRMESYNGVWSVRTSPLYAPKPILNRQGQPIRDSWPRSNDLEFICADQTGLAYLANVGFVKPAEEFVRKVGGTHYVAYPSSVGGYLHVYRIKVKK